VRYVLGIALIAIGLASLVGGGFRWNRPRTSVSTGAFQVQTQERRAVAIPRPLGAVALVAGMFILVAARRSA
jgi:uncharacterized membrane protein YidH (DUF202 family)